MDFQFQCPHCNNILQSDPSQAGTQCECPICSNAFIIPAPATSTAVPAPDPVPSIGPPAAPPEPAIPQINVGGSNAATPSAPPPTSFEAKDPDVLHIPCPECKEILETPLEMLDQDVMCPYCQAQFQLRRRDSVEFKRKKKQELELKERQASRAWLNWAIVAVVLVLLFFGFLIFASSGWE